MIEDDFGSSDEVKVFKDEGEDKEFAASHEELQAALSEDKSSLIQETELSIKQEALRISDPGGKSTLCIFNSQKSCCTRSGMSERLLRKTLSSTIISDEVVDVVVCRVGKWTWRDANHKINKVLSFKKKTKSISINPF